MDTKKLWENTLAEIELTVSKANFNMWFKETRIVRFEDGIVFLSVPNVFVKDWLYNKFHKFILKCLRNNADVRGIEYVVSKDDTKKRRYLRLNANPG
jgi:chromosomal replication initiation ATPase DnaA